LRFIELILRDKEADAISTKWRKQPVFSTKILFSFFFFPLFFCS